MPVGSEPVSFCFLMQRSDKLTLASAVECFFLAKISLAALDVYLGSATLIAS
jgi:hypothetical protein